MANVSYGDIVVELKGKSSGRVYQKTKMGTVQRKLVKPVNRQSALQQNGRLAIGRLSKMWSTITAAERAAWNSAAIAPIDGFKSFIKKNYNLARYNHPITTSPSYTPTPDSIGDAEYNGTVTTPTLHITITIQKGYVSLYVDWGDGITATYSTNSIFDISHTYTGTPSVNASFSISDTSYTASLSTNNGGNLHSFNPQGYSLQTLDISKEKIPVSEVNAILQAYDSYGSTFGILNISGQTPAAAPTGAGITAKNNLITKGWTVTTD